MYIFTTGYLEWRNIRIFPTTNTKMSWFQYMTDYDRLAYMNKVNYTKDYKQL